MERKEITQKQLDKKLDLHKKSGIKLDLSNTNCSQLYMRGANMSGANMSGAGLI